MPCAVRVIHRDNGEATLSLGAAADVIAIGKATDQCRDGRAVIAGSGNILSNIGQGLVGGNRGLTDIGDIDGICLICRFGTIRSTNCYVIAIITVTIRWSLKVCCTVEGERSRGLMNGKK